MCKKLNATYETIDTLHLEGDYDELHQIAQYAIDAILNDEEKLSIRTTMQNPTAGISL